MGLNLLGELGCVDPKSGSPGVEFPKALCDGSSAHSRGSAPLPRRLFAPGGVPAKVFDSLPRYYDGDCGGLSNPHLPVYAAVKPHDGSLLAPNQDVNENGLVFDLRSLFDYLTKIRDPHQNKGKQYPLPILLILMLLAKLGGEDKPSGMTDWVAGRKEQLMALQVLGREKTPCHMTYRRVLQEIVDPQEFEDWISAYHHQRLQEEQEIVLSMDGKILRGTILRGDMRGTHLLTVYVPQQGLVLVQAEVDRKENEIVVALHELKQVNLSGAIVIGDAMHTQ